MVRQLATMLAASVLTVSSFVWSGSVSERPVGVWTRTAGDVLVKFDFRDTDFLVSFTKGGDTIKVVADFSVTEDATVLGRVSASEKDVSDSGAFDARLTPTPGDLFSFRTSMEGGKLVLSDVLGCGPGKPLVEGEYDRELILTKAGRSR